MQSTASLTTDIPAAEQALLDRADEWSTFRELDELTFEGLRQVSRTDGLDFATALLYQRVVRTPGNALFLERIHAAVSQRSSAEMRDATLAFCPGAFYQELPKNGADGKVLRTAARPYLRRIEVVPTLSMGTIVENGARICAWLLQRPANERVILASLSKGGSDIKAALARPDAAEAFQAVVGWVNISGLVTGSPAVSWLIERPILAAAYRLMFRARGLDFNVVMQLQWGRGSPLDFALKVPRHLRVLHIVGFPLRQHFRHPLLRRNHQRMAFHGPNDGLINLWDNCSLPGVIYPVWGADHYMRPRGDSRSLAMQLSAVMLQELMRNDHIQW